MDIIKLASFVIDYCKNNNLNKIYICGNGTSGKTTFSKKIQEEALKYGNVNLISTDDFMVDENLKRNSICKWMEDGIQYTGRYTSSNVESYFLKNIYEILYNIDNGIDLYYFPRRYKENNNIRKLYSDYFLTIIEGMGTAFLGKDKKDSLTLLLKCSLAEEIKRRKERTEKLSRDPIEMYDEKRSSQYRVNILNNEDKYDFVIENDEKFDYTIIKGE